MPIDIRLAQAKKKLSIKSNLSNYMKHENENIDTVINKINIVQTNLE